MTFTQGQKIKAKKTFGIQPPDSKRVRIVKEGAEFWICSSFVDHNQGIVRIAPKGKSSGYSIMFQTKDIEENFENEPN